MKFILSFAFLLGLTPAAFAKNVLLDVRTPQEYNERHLPLAINVDFREANFKNEIAKLNREDTYQVYCKSGRRSASALTAMKELGFKNVEDLKGIEDAAKTLSVSLPPAKPATPAN
jgi:rhodanese-related sulfurtransferase